MTHSVPVPSSLQNAQLLLRQTAALGAEQISAVEGELTAGDGGFKGLHSLKPNDTSLSCSAWSWVELNENADVQQVQEQKAEATSLSVFTVAEL